MVQSKFETNKRERDHEISNIFGSVTYCSCDELRNTVEAMQILYFILLSKWSSSFNKLGQSGIDCFFCSKINGGNAKETS